MYVKSTKDSVENGLTGFLSFLSKTSTMQPRKNAPPPSFSSKKRDVLRAAGKEFPTATTSMIFGYFHMEKKRNRNKRAVQLSIY